MVTSNQELLKKLPTSEHVDSALADYTMALTDHLLTLLQLEQPGDDEEISDEIGTATVTLTKAYLDAQIPVAYAQACALAAAHLFFGKKKKVAID